MGKLYLNEFTYQPPLSTYNEKIIIEAATNKGEELTLIQLGSVSSYEFSVEDSLVLHNKDLVKVIDALVAAYNDSNEIPYARLTDEDRLPNEEKTGL